MKSQRMLTPLVRQMFLVVSFFTLLAPLGLQPLSTSAAASASVRIVHASPDIGTADIFVDGSKFLSAMPFGGVTDYVQVPDGPHKVQIALIGKGPGASVLTQTLTIQAGVVYTVAAIGTNATGFSLNVFEDNNLVSTGQAKVRVYHLSPGTGSVSVANGGNTLVNGLSYPQASNYLTVPAGSYTFNVTSSQSNLNMPVAANLKANSVTSLFAIGMLNGNPKFQFVAAQVSGTPGVPSTGSDPYAQPSEPSSPLNPWFLSLGVLAAIGGGEVIRRLLVVRRRTKGSSAR